MSIRIHFHLKIATIALPSQQMTQTNHRAESRRKQTQMLCQPSQIKGINHIIGATWRSEREGHSSLVEILRVLYLSSSSWQIAKLVDSNRTKVL
eukprot:748400-Hanusia_phi.AAC.2